MSFALFVTVSQRGNKKKKKPHCIVCDNKLLTLQAAATRFTYTRAMIHGYSLVEQRLSI